MENRIGFESKIAPGNKTSACTRPAKVSGTRHFAANPDSRIRKTTVHTSSPMMLRVKAVQCANSDNDIAAVDL
jgi:hypothetical protein